MRYIDIQDVIGWNGSEPLIQKGIEYSGILCGGDVDPVTRRESGCYRFLTRHQSDDEFRARLGSPNQGVESLAKIIFRFSQQVSAKEEAGEAMEVEIESAVHQSHLRGGAQFPFLFGAQEVIIDLIGQPISFILFEQGLKWTVEMSLEGCSKSPGSGQCTYQSCFAYSAGTYDADEFIQSFPLRGHRLFGFKIGNLIFHLADVWIEVTNENCKDNRHTHDYK